LVANNDDNDDDDDNNYLFERKRKASLSSFLSLVERPRGGTSFVRAILDLFYRARYVFDFFVLFRFDINNSESFRYKQ